MSSHGMWKLKQCPRTAVRNCCFPTVSVIIKSLLLSMGCFSGEDTDVVIAAARSTMNADGGVEEAARPTPKGWRASSNAGTGLVATSASECG